MSLRKPSFESEDERHEINLAPLIDVMFVLLLFFVVTMVFSEKSTLGIDRPAAANAQNLSESAYNIFMDKNGMIIFEGREISLDALRLALDSSVKNTAVIDADGGLDLSNLVEVMDVCRECGIERLYIAADKRRPQK